MIANSKAKIKKFLERIAQRPIKDENQDLIAAGVLDSFSMIELIAFLESEFGVEVNMELLNRDNFNSLNYIVKALEKWRR